MLEGGMCCGKKQKSQERSTGEILGRDGILNRLSR